MQFDKLSVNQVLHEQIVIVFRSSQVLSKEEIPRLNEKMFSSAAGGPFSQAPYGRRSLAF